MADVESSQLGKATSYVDRYSPELLFPIARKESRVSLGIKEALPFSGEDVWTSFELSWLDDSGKPQVALGTFIIPCDSPNIIESKSFKLYLNSFNQERLSSRSELIDMMSRDLSKAAGAEVKVSILALQDATSLSQPNGFCVDTLSASYYVYEPSAKLLQIDDQDYVEESLYSDLLRSNCPVTGQPDWGTVVIRYKGPKISPESFLQYVVSYRNCQDFHEHCCERMFVDLMKECGCEELSVMTRYTRRGGLDINPYRVTKGYSSEAPNLRFARQ